MNCNPGSLWIPSIAAGVLASVCLAGPTATATAQGADVTIVADQVRSQGFPCDNPARLSLSKRSPPPITPSTCSNAKE